MSDLALLCAIGMLCLAPPMNTWCFVLGLAFCVSGILATLRLGNETI